MINSADELISLPDNRGLHLSDTPPPPRFGGGGRYRGRKKIRKKSEENGKGKGNER
jgi:hypothetical protein